MEHVTLPRIDEYAAGGYIAKDYRTPIYGYDINTHSIKFPPAYIKHVS